MEEEAGRKAAEREADKLHDRIGDAMKSSVLRRYGPSLKWIADLLDNDPAGYEDLLIAGLPPEGQRVMRAIIEQRRRAE